MRSIFNFISFPGIADSDGGFDRAPGFSIDYSGDEIEDVERQKKWKFLKILKYVFFQFFGKLQSIFAKHDS